MKSLLFKIVCFLSLGSLDLPPWRLRAFLLEAMSQNQSPGVQPAKQPKYLTTKFNPNFPKVIRARHLFKKLGVDAGQFLDQLQCPCDLLCLLACQPIQKFLDRTFLARCPVESDFIHVKQVNIYVNQCQKFPARISARRSPAPSTSPPELPVHSPRHSPDGTISPQNG